jgi:3-oxoacyl-[acyl-carrier protein] reductase
VNHLVITGGSGGLGQAVIKAFAGSDWEIAAPTHAELDMEHPERFRGYFESRPTTLLVCAAGITRDTPIARIQETDWDQVFRVNYEGAAACASTVIPSMVRAGSGHIVFISSQSAIHPPVGQAAYATAKAALLGLTTTLSRRWGSRRIRVNAILPGFLETPMTTSVSPKRKQAILESHDLGRFNTPEEVAGFLHFLHHRLPHTSGQTFQLDSRSTSTPLER